MAEILPADARQVFDRVGEAAAAYQNCREPHDVYRLINSLELITAAQATADETGDDAAMPYDYPLSAVVILERNPALTEATSNERYDRQFALAKKYVLDKAASDLCVSLKAKTDTVTGDPNGFKYQALKTASDEALKSLAAYVTKLKTGDVTAAGQPEGAVAVGGSIQQERYDGYAIAYRSTTELA